MTRTNLAYHFTGDTLRDGSPIPPIGEWLEHKGDVKLCESGLHFSRHPFDAMEYAPGALLHLVEVEDIVAEREDKGVCRRRKIIATIDATDLLRSCARKWALDVVHLWDAPDVVIKWLKTGDETLRAEARVSARRTAENAAYSAAWSAAYSAAWNAAYSAAENAAYSAAWNAAYSARASALSAARSARAPAWSAAERAATAKQREYFTRMVDKAFKENAK